MEPPKTTHRQFAILNLLEGGPLWGREILASLKADGYKGTHAAFYDLMSRLEDGELIVSEYEFRETGGVGFPEKRYGITDKGTAAITEISDYYQAKLKRRWLLGGLG